MDFFTPGHLVVIIVVAVVVLFGWKKLPDMSRSVGRSLRIFKTEMKALDTEVAAAVSPAPAPATGNAAGVTQAAGQALPPVADVTR